MIKVLSRPPTDDFSFYIWKDLLSQISQDYEAYYLWSTPPERLETLLKCVKFQKPLVIIAVKDLLDMWKEFNHWTDRQTAGAKLLSETARAYPEKRFVIFTSIENLQAEINEPNVQIVQWGGDIVNQFELYPGLEPVLNKNFDNPQHYISLNRHSRIHRLVLLSYLYGLELDQFGKITFLSQTALKSTNLLDQIDWRFSTRHQQDRKIILDGYTKICQQPDITPIKVNSVYIASNNDNVRNFNLHLRPMYENSVVEVVTESSFSAPGFNLTEKTQNAFYACNFPIVLGGRGIVQHLRDLGFDMYDDVIDHSYDSVANPFDRIIAAVKNNQRLLCDADYARQQWLACRTRIEANVDVVRNVYSWYERRARQQFAALNLNQN